MVKELAVVDEVKEVEEGWVKPTSFLTFILNLIKPLKMAVEALNEALEFVFSHLDGSSPIASLAQLCGILLLAYLAVWATNAYLVSPTLARFSLFGFGGQQVADLLSHILNAPVR